MALHKQHSMAQDWVQCSAPGSTIIMGEHAVLHGYPAIVAALQGRITVTLERLPDGRLNVDSAVGQWRSRMSEALATKVDKQPLRFVLAAVQYYAQQASFCTGLAINIESDIDTTQGLGSSAALTVAMVGALRRYHGLASDKVAILTDAVTLIRQVQGSGSGADAAASCYGGLVHYQAKDIVAKPLLSVGPEVAGALPDLRLVYVGYKTPTPEVIAKVNQWAQAEPLRYFDIYAAMGELVAVAETAIKQQNWQALAIAMRAYQQQMVNLGVCDEGTAKAITAAQAALSRLPHAEAAAVKISGSGMGDCILGLNLPKVPDWPYMQTPIAISMNGVVWQ